MTTSAGGWEKDKKTTPTSAGGWGKQDNPNPKGWGKENYPISPGGPLLLNVMR